MVNNTREWIELDEGRVPHVYQDSLGYWTVGVGHLVDKRRGGKLPDPIIDALLDWDIQAVQAELTRALPWVPELGDVREAVLTNMAFNLGVSGLLGFKNTLQAVKEKRWDDASAGMLASKWAGQVGPRAQRLAESMRTGRWPGEVLVGPY